MLDNNNYNEIKEKEEKLINFMNIKGLDGVIISKANNWSWVTGGRDARIVYSKEANLVDLVITNDLQKYCISTNVEAPRLEKEDLNNLDYKIISFPWYDYSEKLKIVKSLIGGKKFASDTAIEGAISLDSDFDRLRYSLTKNELKKYRLLGEWCRDVVESAAKEIEPGMTEQVISGIVTGKLGKKGIFCDVIMVAADERIFSFRHPLITSKKINKYVMILICASRWGLFLAMTRLVHFGKLPEELEIKIRKVTEIDAKLIVNTRPDKAMKDFDMIIPQAYKDAGYPDMWKMHYQGGPIGYGDREYEWEPNSEMGFYNNQAIAWNPTITGTKSEDTFLYIDGNIEIVSLKSNGNWPIIEHNIGGKTILRPSILIR